MQHVDKWYLCLYMTQSKIRMLRNQRLSCFFLNFFLSLSNFFLSYTYISHIILVWKRNVTKSNYFVWLETSEYTHLHDHISHAEICTEIFSNYLIWMNLHKTYTVCNMHMHILYLEVFINCRCREHHSMRWCSIRLRFYCNFF